MKFDWEVVSTYWRQIAEVVPVTIRLFLGSLALGVTIGLILALMRLSKLAPLRFVAWAYVSFFRGIPSLIVLFFAFFALPQFGIRLSPIQAGILGLGVDAGAYKAEIIRAGIISVDKGQWEAAKALGIPGARLFRRIILPQSIRIMIPPFFSNSITLLKATSLASVITINEITGVSRRLIASTFSAFELLAVAAFMYLVLSSVLVGLQLLAERTFALKE